MAPQIPTINEEAQITYLTVRALGLPQKRALEELRIPLRAALELEPAVPAPDAVALATRRSRANSEGRAVTGNIHCALSPTGREIMGWLKALPAADLNQLRALFVRAEASTQASSIDFWTRITQLLPNSFSLQVRIGQHHVSTKNLVEFEVLKPKVSLRTDPRIGGRPVLSFHPPCTDNRVVSARLTAVARTQALAIAAHRSLTRAMEE